MKDAEDLADIVISVSGGRPVYLRDVAVVVDGPEEPATYVRFGKGPPSAPTARMETGRESYPAVTPLHKRAHSKYN